MKDQADFVEFDFRDLFPGLLEDKGTRFEVSPSGETADLDPPEEMHGYTTLSMIFTNHGDAKNTTAETVEITDVEDLPGDDGGVVITGVEFSGTPITITVEYGTKEKA